MKLNSEKYWEDRTAQNEAKAAKTAAKASKEQQKIYKNAYNKINKTLDGLYEEIAISGRSNVSRSDLWKYKKYIELRNIVGEEINAVGRNQIKLLDTVTEKVFEDTIEKTVSDFDMNYSKIGHSQLNKVINTNWSGINYSDRIYQNTDELAIRLQEDLTDMVVLGKTPAEVKRKVQEDFNVSYNVADRLIRTETSFIYNAAAIEGYKEAGVKQVKFIAEADCCDKCAEYSGKIFNIGEEPFIPAHPNCRCCYAPVVDIGTLNKGN